ncbi:MAG: hypothetical protein IPL41_04630 [Micropruina sp.]|nr:hypothetical protein [Micropruina sp.]
MHISGSGRFVFIAQGFLAVLLPIWFFIGRGLVGAQLGWLMVVGIIVYGIVVIILLLVPPLISLADADVRAQKAERAWYSTSSCVLWGAILLAALVVPDAADSPPPLDTALTTWTGGAIDHAASRAIFTVLAVVIALGYLATLVLAVAGVVRSRSRSGAPRARS